MKTPSPQFDFMLRPNRGLRVFLEGFLLVARMVGAVTHLVVERVEGAAHPSAERRLGLAGLHELLVDNHYVNDESVGITIDLYAKGFGGIRIAGAAAPEAIGFELVPADSSRPPDSSG